MTEVQKVSQESESTKALQVIKAAIAGATGLKLVVTPSTTGVSFFAGKDRLCKLLNTKKGVTLEINVILPKKLADLPDMESISKQQAHKKHLGTMKHLYRSSDAKLVKEIITAALEQFKKNQEAKHAEEVKEVKQEEQAAKEA